MGVQLSKKYVVLMSGAQDRLITSNETNCHDCYKRDKMSGNVTKVTVGAGVEFDLEYSHV